MSTQFLGEERELLDSLVQSTVGRSDAEVDASVTKVVENFFEMRSRRVARTTHLRSASLSADIAWNETMNLMDRVVLVADEDDNLRRIADSWCRISEGMVRRHASASRPSQDTVRAGTPVSSSGDPPGGYTDTRTDPPDEATALTEDPSSHSAFVHLPTYALRQAINEATRIL